MPSRLKNLIFATLFLCLGGHSVLAFPPSYDYSRLPENETCQFSLTDPLDNSHVGTLYESLHLEDRYGLGVYTLSRRFEGDVYELETIEFEAESFIPIRAVRVQKVRGMNVETEIQFQSTRAVITVREPELLGGKTTTTMLDIPRDAITLQQLPYALRTKSLTPGDQYDFEVIPLFGQKQEALTAKASVKHVDEESGLATVDIAMDGETWTVSLSKAVVKTSGRAFTATIGLNGLEITVE